MASRTLFGVDLGPGADFPINGRTPAQPGVRLRCVVVVALIAMVVASVRAVALGQRMLAVRSNERAAAAAGIDVRDVS